VAARWPGALAAGLGPGFEVIAEGLGGRTTAYDDHVADCDRNGARILPTILHSHRPVHLAILLLGTNDLKPAVAGSASAAFLGMKRCVEIVQKHSPRLPGFAGTKVLIVAPPAIVATADTFFTEMFAGGIAESRKLAGYYEALAAEMSCAFFDAGQVASASPFDGVHLDAANTRAIGTALVPIVRALLAD
ncbi:MAG: GDSL-type esterase/lipase family protein, partial [Hyphomicrobiales bacterium]|nr:GDSL-type esterase/lipase family protein [Hyphomicrobiales bacterium]